MPGAVTALAHARLLADAIAEVVELRAVDVADRLDLDLLDLRRVERERPLDADAGGDLPHRERLADARALALDDDPVEHLDATTRALDHLEVNADGVAGLEVRHLAQLGALEILNDVAHKKMAGRPTGKGSGADAKPEAKTARSAT